MQSTSATRKQYQTQQRTQRELLIELRRIWRGMGGDWDTSWARISPDIVGAVSAAQLSIAQATTDYLDDFLAEVDLANQPLATARPDSVVGLSSSGYPLDSLLYGGVAASRSAAREQALNAPGSLREGYKWLSMVASSQIADVARTMTSVGVAARPNINGYTRFLNPPSCSRCAILAGRVYRYSTGFQRHPRCDCTMQPAPSAAWAKSEGFVSDPTEAWKNGDIHGLSRADIQALTDGADLARIVNAGRGMSTTFVGASRTRGTKGIEIKYSPRTGYYRAGTAPKIVKPTPEMIYRSSTSRNEALALLREHGYIT